MSGWLSESLHLRLGLVAGLACDKGQQDSSGEHQSLLAQMERLLQRRQ